MSVANGADIHKERWWRGSGFARAAVMLPAVVSIAIALLVYGRHLFDLGVPLEEDVRAHLFHIDILHSYLAHGSWPQWIPYWYHGFAAFQYYPPGFHLLGAVLTFVFQHAVISYKFLLFLTMISSGLAVYYFSRRFLKLDLVPSLVCLIAYESSAPLLVNYSYGVGPNLLGWSVCVFFLTVYLCNVTENKVHGASNIVLPGLLFGITTFIHPFPVIFAILAVIIFHIIRLTHKFSWSNVKSQLLYFVAVFGVAAVISIHYWLPALLTRDYLSPIYTLTRYAWLGGEPFLLAFASLALAAGFIIRRRVASEPKLDLVIAYAVLALVLGFGASRYLPFGLGSLVHEFRFATIMAPFFEILLIGLLLNYRPAQLKRDKLAIALAITAGVMSVIFINSAVFDFLIKYAKVISGMGLELRHYFPLSLVFREFIELATVGLLFCVILLVALSLDSKPRELKKNGLVVAVATSVCLILMVSVLPFLFTYKQAHLVRLFSYVEHYRQPEYSQVLYAATDGRLVVPIERGHLCEGDSPVTFGWHYGVETVNGSYNQGDPKFFKHTVHLEWEDRWLDYEHTRENLMQESGAKYIFIRGNGDSHHLLTNTDGLTCVVDNDYGQLFELNQDVARAVNVTPVLLDVENQEQVTEFFNILLPKGYRMVLVNVDEVPEELEAKFEYVMVDDESKLSHYKDKKAFLLCNIDVNSEIAIAEGEGVIRLNLPYLSYTNKLFYYGDKGNVAAWRFFDDSRGARPSQSELVAMQRVGNEMSRYLGNLNYEAVSYRLAGDGVELITEPGFTLVRDSYFPYWDAGRDKILSTSQGFMLIYTDDSTVSLSYEKPIVNTIATMISIVCFTAAIIVLLVAIISERLRSRKLL